MQKTKLIAGLITYLVLGLFSASGAIAFTPSIQTLPSYINTNSFKISCTASGTTAQFMYRKEGGSFANLGSPIDLGTSQCLVQVTSSEVSDQTKYYFKVNVDGTDSAETSTTYDISGPSPVSGYYKEQVGSGFYKLHWKNPGDSDFAKVIIYRGETSDFSGDGSHQIAEVSGGSNSDMTYDEHQPDPNKTYYYLIRALDKANNSSSLVGDGGGTVTASATPASGSGSSGGSVLGSSSTGKVTQLPKEEEVVLGADASPSSSPYASPKASEGSMDKAGLMNWISTHKMLSLGILAAFILGIFGLGSLRKK